jgi:hypothetical protein
MLAEKAITSRSSCRLPAKAASIMAAPAQRPTVKEAAVTDAITIPCNAFSNSVGRTSDQSKDAGART